MDISIYTVLPTLELFIAKFIFILFLTMIFNTYQIKRYNFIIAWAFSYLYEIFLMLLLSSNHHLHKQELLIVSILSLVFVSIFLFFRCMHTHRTCWNHFTLDISNLFPLTALIAFTVYCAVRSFLYFDTTADALCYGMPRIFIFSTNDTLFVNMDSLVKNIFCNEWNGELNAVFYRIMTGNNISIPFANIESYFYAMVGLFLLGNEWFGRKWQGIIWSFSVMFLPVVVFLAFTCKGDMLGMLTFPMFFFTLLLFWREQRHGTEDMLLLYGAIALSAVATGARITVIPAVGLIMVITIVNFVKLHSIRQLLPASIVTALCYLIGGSRYIINLFVYGNLFERVDAPNEKISFSIVRFFHTTRAYLSDLWHGDNFFTHEGTRWALNADAGLCGGISLIGFIGGTFWILLFLIRHKEKAKPYAREIFAAFSVFIGLLFCLSSMDYLAWSFRYFAPYFICLFMGLILILHYVSSTKLQTVCWYIIIPILTLNAYSTISLATLQGEVTGDSWQNMQQKDEIHRRYAFHSYFLDEGNGIMKFYDRIRTDSNILLCSQCNQGISWIWGDNAENNVTLCSPENIQELYNRQTWDAIVTSDIIPLDTSFLPLSEYQHYKTDLDLDVFIKSDVYKEEFEAKNFSNDLISEGVYEYDGLYCWLRPQAYIPIQMSNIENGVDITYAAGTDLSPLDGISTPKIKIYVDDVLAGEYGVEYTGEYTVHIPQEYFTMGNKTYLFSFEINAVIAPELSIRLKEIVPAYE